LHLPAYNILSSAAPVLQHNPSSYRLLVAWTLYSYAVAAAIFAGAAGPPPHGTETLLTTLT